MLEMSWITAILQLYSQVTDLFRNAIVKRINIRLFDLLARFHYIWNLPRILCFLQSISIVNIAISCMGEMSVMCNIGDSIMCCMREKGVM